ncbi:hypothetical protein [[Mycobacterium] wendilense]|uniref:Uncharacterized protein n=1 Tax=[Mycobacterium] wendilense TaxID=3064284 RepID=A0ABM9MF24_9MYCO|nr:hypothetical protein [Mycolicibacterium sp. MU0050]CAJ1583622.1 hypothetical protein MU0050_002721 [Mycolicibacterium sp. MU0050]
MTSHGGDRPVWHVNAPPGGWPLPWPQVIEIVNLIPHTQWTLIGGIMVQLHAAHAGFPLTRPTNDVDMILHIETGEATFQGVQHQLERIGYELLRPSGDGPAHRFVRGPEQVDVMVADRLPPKWRPTAFRRPVFAVPGGTSALRKTVNCEVDTAEGIVVVSVPDVLGALVLKGAAYIGDSRDRARHVDDAAVLACMVSDPVADRARMSKGDSKRIRALWSALQDRRHRSWIATGRESGRGHAALRLLAGN